MPKLTNRLHVSSRDWWPEGRRRYYANESVDEIAHRFKVTKSAVYTMLSKTRAGQRSDLVPRSVVECFFMYPEDKAADIARRLSITPRQVAAELLFRGIPYNLGFYVNEDDFG